MARSGRDIGKLRRHLLLLLLGVGIGLAASGLARLPALAVFENLTRDLRMAYLAPPRLPHEDIVILGITEETLRRFPYRSPVHRGFLANLITLLEERRARAVALDILFDRPTEPALDHRLKTTLNRTSLPVIIATGGGEAGLDAAQQAFQADFTRGLATGAARLVGDPFDHVIRRQRPLSGGPSLAAATARALGIEVAAGERAIDFRRTADSGARAFATYPAETAELLPAAWLEDKVVLIGALLADDDRHLTPLSRAAGIGETPGVEIQAHMLAQLLEGSHVPLVGPQGALLLAITAGLLGIGLGLLALPIWGKLLLVVGALAAYWIGAFAWYELGGPLLPLLPATLAFPVAAGGSELWLGREARAQRRFIKNAFAQYLAPEVVDQLLADPASLKLGGEEREITLLFTDLAGFTTLSEQLDPETMNRLLNDYLEEAMQIVLEHGGTIDKLVGDAIHAFFGAPVTQPDHARRALSCAAALDRALEARRRRLEAEGIAWETTRIGVHTGPAVVGNFGGRQRFDYTAYGDVVNTVARLENVNRHLGTRVCVAATTAKACPHPNLRPIGALLLVGKAQPLFCFELVHGPTDAYRQAFADLEAGDVAAASAGFAAIAGCDRLAALHLGRLEAGEHGTLIRLAEK